jgi:hypothetical protein
MRFTDKTISRSVKRAFLKLQLPLGIQQLPQWKKFRQFLYVQTIRLICSTMPKEFEYKKFCSFFGKITH